MTRARFTISVATVACMLGATPAYACYVSGQVVCSNDTSIGLSGIDLTLTPELGGTSYPVSSDSDGFIYVPHVDPVGTYDINPTTQTFYCGPLTGYAGIWGLVVEVDDARCGTCTITVPAGFQDGVYCPDRPFGSPKSECERFGLGVLDKDDGTGGLTWAASQSARIALVKAGSCYSFFENVSAGDILTSPNGQSISHVTYCACK